MAEGSHLYSIERLRCPSDELEQCLDGHNVSRYIELVIWLIQQPRNGSGLLKGDGNGN